MTEADRSYHRKWYEKHREQQLAYRREWYAKNPEKQLAYNRRWMDRKIAKEADHEIKNNAEGRDLIERPEDHSIP